MQIVAGLMALYVAFCWFLFIRRRYEPAFLLPMLCFSALALMSIAMVFLYADRLARSGGRMFGVFLMITLITAATLKPNRTLVWLIVAWTGCRAVTRLAAVTADPSPLAVAYVAIELVAALSLLHVVQFRPTLFDMRTKEIKSAFD